MSRVKLNLLANFGGQAWTALMGLAFVPLYIKFMGIEAYGLIGFYVTLQGIANLLDFGLSPTMNREMARYSARPESADEARDLVRTLEAGYWAIGVLLGAAVALAAPWIATHWVKAQELPVPVVQQAVMIMGLVTALQWPLSFYQGGLLGLQKQALLQAINVGVGTLRGVGAVLILWRISPTVTAFFTWQIVVSALQVSLITFFLWRSLPPDSRAPRFDARLLRNIWRFAAGMSATSLVTLLLTQLDKVILSNLLNLEMFGYYTLAGTVANALYNVIGPVFSALFPQFSALVARGDHQGLTRVYHRGCQLMATVTLPVALMVCLFARELILLWTANPLTADRVAPIASLTRPS